MRIDYIGIDPGLTGALARITIDDEDAGFEAIEIQPMPSIKVVRNNKDKIVVDPYGIARVLAKWEPDTTLVTVEWVTASPQMGPTSAFSFGRSLGVLEGVLAGLELNINFVRPQDWKKDIGLPRGATKTESRKIATEYYPDHQAKWKLAKDDGMAEALLIARWGKIYGHKRG